MKLSGVYDFFNEQFFSRVDDVFAVSDTHFGDQELRDGTPARMTDDEMVAAINKVCGKASALVHLGDVGDLSYVQKLRAKVKILVLGNHDGAAANYKRDRKVISLDRDKYSREEAIQYACDSYPGYVITSIEEAWHPTLAPFERWVIGLDNKLFDYVFEGPVFLGEKLVLSHEPIPMITYAMNLHGHIHAAKRPDGNLYHYNINWDVIKQPYHLSAALKKGLLSKITTLHRQTIDYATKRKEKRNEKHY